MFGRISSSVQPVRREIKFFGMLTLCQDTGYKNSLDIFSVMTLIFGILIARVYCSRSNFPYRDRFSQQSSDTKVQRYNKPMNIDSTNITGQGWSDVSFQILEFELPPVCLGRWPRLTVTDQSATVTMTIRVTAVIDRGRATDRWASTNPAYFIEQPHVRYDLAPFRPCSARPGWCPRMGPR
jgi:hypothetical protein